MGCSAYKFSRSYAYLVKTQRQKPVPSFAFRICFLFYISKLGRNKAYKRILVNKVKKQLRSVSLRSYYSKDLQYFESIYSQFPLVVVEVILCTFVWDIFCYVLLLPWNVIEILTLKTRISPEKQTHCCSSVFETLDHWPESWLSLRKLRPTLFLVSVDRIRLAEEDKQE